MSRYRLRAVTGQPDLLHIWLLLPVTWLVDGAVNCIAVQLKYCSAVKVLQCSEQYCSALVSTAVQ